MQALPSNHTYALDRTSLKGTTASKGTTVEPSKGALSSAFPIGPKAGNAYHFYDSTTRNIVPLRYAGHDKIRGRSLNVYTVAATGPVKDPGLLKMLPPALPKKLFAGLASLLPADVRAKATPATLAALPDPVPFTYTGITHITADVDRQTGVPINEHINEQVVANITAGGQTLSLIPVLALDFQITPASQKYLADKASSSGTLLTVMELVVPIVLVVLGVVLVVIAVLRRRRPTPSVPSFVTTSKPEPQPER